MLKIIFNDNLFVVVEISKEEADKQITKICNSKSKWITLNASNSYTTYNKDLIALMESK